MLHHQIAYKLVKFICSIKNFVYAKKRLAEMIFFDYIKSSTGDWCRQSSLAI